MSRPGNTRAILTLEGLGVDFEVHPYDMDTLDQSVSYGEAVAAQIGASPERVFKTLVAEVDDEPVVAIVPVEARLSLKMLARAAGGKKAQLADAANAERWTGYHVGGISPFGQRRRLPVYVDATLERFDTVYVSGGQRGIQLELSPGELMSVLDATAADLTG